MKRTWMRSGSRILAATVVLGGLSFAFAANAQTQTWVEPSYVGQPAYGAPIGEPCTSCGQPNCHGGCAKTLLAPIGWVLKLFGAGCNHQCAGCHNELWWGEFRDRPCDSCGCGATYSGAAPYYGGGAVMPAAPGGCASCGDGQVSYARPGVTSGYVASRSAPVPGYTTARPTPAVMSPTPATTPSPAPIRSTSAGWQPTPAAPVTNGASYRSVQPQAQWVSAGTSAPGYAPRPMVANGPVPTRAMQPAPQGTVLQYGNGNGSPNITVQDLGIHGEYVGAPKIVSVTDEVVKPAQLPAASPDARTASSPSAAPTR